MFLLVVTAFIASSLCGCGESKTTPPDSNAVTPPARSVVEPTPTAKPVAETAAPAKPAVETSTPVATTPVKAAVTDLSAQFAQAAAAQTDKLLGSIGGDLAGKVKSLSQSLGVNDALKSQLDGEIGRAHV